MTVRVGFLGGGFIATYHRQMLEGSGADVVVAAVHDPDPARAEAFAAASGAVVAGSEQELIDAVDAVYVCTWTSEHPRLVAAAAAAGRAVFVEKPLAVSLAESTDVVRSLEEAGVVHQVGLVLRDSPAFGLLRWLIGRPESGPLMSVVFRDDQYLPTQGMYASTWRGERDKAGSGTLLEHSIHDLDLLEWLAGPVEELSATTREFHGIDGIEDLAAVTAHHAGGAVSTLVSVWHDVLARPSQRRVEVFCQRAWYALEGDVFGPVRWSVQLEDGGVDEGVLEGSALLEHLGAEGVALRNPDGGFVDAVVAGGPASPAARVALRAHVLADAAYRSATAGGTPLVVAPGTPLDEHGGP
jgi:predicted dehydrogenase